MRSAGEVLASRDDFDAMRDPELIQHDEGAKSSRGAPSAGLPATRPAEAEAPFNDRDDEIASTWRLVAFNWRLLGGIAGVVVAVLLASEFYVDPSGYVAIFAIAALYWWFGLRNAHKAPGGNPRVFFSLTALAQIMLAIPVILTLTYLTTSVSLPLLDTRLLAWDRALGFDFLSLLDFVNRHPELIPLIARAYGSINFQMILMVLALPLAGCYLRGAEAVCAYVLALLATTTIAILVPAIGVYQVLGLQPSDYPYFEPQGYYDTLRDAPLLRAGLLHKLHLTQLVGVVTFPSFHAGAAILYMWAFWPLRWLRPVVIPWNIVMIVATPLGGGHYLSDILAGIAVSVAAIMVTAKISQACASNRGGLPSYTLPNRIIS